MKACVYVAMDDAGPTMLGLTYFDPEKRVRVGHFYFENLFFMKEFCTIADGEIARKRTLSFTVPIDLKGILTESKIAGGEGIQSGEDDNGGESFE